QYNYLGQLELTYSGGNLTDFGGDAFRVVDQSLPDGVAPDGDIQSNVVGPLLDDLAALNTVIGQTNVTLDGTRSLVRTQETNYGNLIADSILDAGQESSVIVGADSPIIGLTNGGGIRNSVIIPEGGDITQLAIDRTLPFGNEVVIIEDVSPEQLKLVLERAVSAVENVSGRFSQVAGLSFTYDPDADAAAFTFDDDGNIVSVDNAGQRIIDVVLDDDIVIIEDGEVVAGLENLMIDIATVDFLAGGGDGYPYEFLGLEAVTTGIDYADALASFIADDLNGIVEASQYPISGEGRISVVPEPTGIALLGLPSVALLRRRR
ncbi:MAG: 5'-nucleotidase C-terminal domain-containing protein, partial [Planctomycetota bacterium]